MSKQLREIERLNSVGADETLQSASVFCWNRLLKTSRRAEDTRPFSNTAITEKTPLGYKRKNAVLPFKGMYKFFLCAFFRGGG